MLKIRLQRTGRRNDPSFRIVVIEHTASTKAGTNVALVGSHHPKTKKTIIDAEQVKKWLSHGAKASGTMHNLLISKGVIEGKKVNVLRKKTPIVKETPAAEETPAKEGVEESPAEETPTEHAAEEGKKEESPAA